MKLNPVLEELTVPSPVKSVRSDRATTRKTFTVQFDTHVGVSFWPKKFAWRTASSKSLLQRWRLQIDRRKSAFALC